SLRLKIYFSGRDFLLAIISNILSSDALRDFPDLERFIQQGYCYQNGSRLRLTETGMALSDCLAPVFVSPEVMLRENRQR
ncbi:coproporphyrinogen III oxidase, partial [Salmonella enterica subsp. enterica serovar Newport str. S09097]